MADIEGVWKPVDKAVVIDFDEVEFGVGISLGHPHPDDDYPTVILLEQIKPDGRRVVEVVGQEEPPFTLGPSIFIPKTVRQTIDPDSELVIGRSEEHNTVGLDLGRLASRTHLSLQRDSGRHASRITLRDLNSRHGTFINIPV